MRLDDKEFSEYKSLQKLVAEGKASPADVQRLAELDSKKKSDSGNLKQDPQWISRYPELLKGVSTLALNTFPGGTNALPFEVNSLTYNYRADLTNASVMQLNVLLTPGMSDNPDSGINRISDATYMYMGRKFRNLGTNTAYQASDLGIVLFCICNIFAAIADLERIYGLKQHYNAVNSTVPKIYGQILGVDFDSINLATFRASINELILSANKLAMPKGMFLIDRWYTMFSRVFADQKDNVREPNNYIFTTGGYYRYVQTRFAEGGQAMYVAKNWNNASEATILTYVRNMIGQLRTNNADFARMNSDILSAFAMKTSSGEPDYSTLYRLSLLPEEYIVRPEYNEDWLEEIHNAMVVAPAGIANQVNFPVKPTIKTSVYNNNSSVPYILDIPVLYQEHNILYFGLHADLQINGLTATDFYANSGFTMSVYSASPVTITEITAKTWYGCVYDSWNRELEPAKVAELSSFKYAAKTFFTAADNGNGTYDDVIYTGIFTTFGTEIVTFANLYKCVNDVVSLVSVGGDVTTEVYLMAVERFDWHPQFEMINCTISSSSTLIPSSADQFGSELDLYTIIQNGLDYLAPIHRNNTLSLLSFEAIVPLLAGNK